MSGRLPSGWEWATFTDVAHIAANLVSPADWPDMPHVAPDNIQGHTGTLLPYRTILEDGVKSAKHHFHAGQLLYSKIRPNLNKCIRVDFDGLCSADMYPLDSFITSRFLQYYILSQLFVRDVVAAAGSRTVLPKTNQKQLAGVAVPVAPESEQVRVAIALDSYLSRLDAATATLERVQANLKRYRASVLKAAVEGRLVPTEAELARKEGREYEPASVLLERILKERRQRWEEDAWKKETEKAKQKVAKARRKAEGRPWKRGDAFEPGEWEGIAEEDYAPLLPKNDKWKAKYKKPAPPDTTGLPELPEGWCWAAPEQLARPESYALAIGPFGSNLKVSDYRTEGVPLIFVRNIRAGRFDGPDPKFVSSGKAQDLAAHAVDAGDILITKMGEPPGDACLYPPGMPRAIITADCIKWRPATGVIGPYLVLALGAQSVRDRVLEMTKGVAQKKVSLARFRTLAVPLPPSHEQARIAEECDRLTSCAARTAEVAGTQAKRFGRLRHSILKWAFEGKLVDQDPNDEPASVLLDRIKADRDAVAAKAKPKKRAKRKKKATK